MQFVYKQIQGFRELVLSRVFATGVLLAAIILFLSQMAGGVHQAYIPRGLETGSAGMRMAMLSGEPGQPMTNGMLRLLPQRSELEQMEEESDEIAVKVTADGESTEYTVLRGLTVEQLLAEQGIAYGEDDRVSPALGKELTRGTEIVIQRVVYEYETLEEELPYEVVYKDTSLLKEGQTRVLQQGKDGRRRVTYAACIVDGEITREDEQDVVMLSERVDEVVLVGAQVAISPLEFEDVALDENGVPVEYQQLLTDQIATGYSARKGAKTASGRYAITGHVAVDPKDIPYGSRLYITSSDGDFVYGYAIAADTGTGLMQDIVDVDLFYDTYRESAMNGRKIVDIYLLD